MRIRVTRTLPSHPATTKASHMGVTTLQDHSPMAPAMLRQLLSMQGGRPTYSTPFFHIAVFYFMLLDACRAVSFHPLVAASCRPSACMSYEHHLAHSNPIWEGGSPGGLPRTCELHDYGRRTDRRQLFLIPRTASLDT